MDIKTPEILLAAVRQYQHNDCTGLLFGFDHDETIKVVISQQEEISNLKKLMLKACLELESWNLQAADQDTIKIVNEINSVFSSKDAE